MTEFEIGLVGTGALLLMVFAGVRIYTVAAIVGVIGVVYIIGWDAGAGIGGTVPHSKSVNYALSVLPMFILIGFIAYHAGLTHALFRAAKAWVGWVPGGLAVASVFATAGFAAVSGASTATAAVFSRVAIPHMLDAGYDRRLAAGVVAAETLRKGDSNAEIHMIGGEPEPPYSRMAIPYLLEGNIAEGGTYLRKTAGHYDALAIQYSHGRVETVAACHRSRLSNRSRIARC